MPKMKKLLGIMLIAVLAVTAIGCGSEVVASINGQEISRDQLDKRVNKVKLAYEQQGASFEGEQGEVMLKAIEQQTLDQMINEALIEQAADKEGVAPSKEDIEKSFAEVKGRFNSEQEFEDALKSYNYTEEELKEYIAQQAVMDALYQKVTKDVKVNEEDIQKYYDENKDQFNEPEKVKARHILIKFDTETQQVGRTEEEAKQIAEEILAEIKGGKDFAELAKEKSEDGSKDDGGLLKSQTGEDYTARGNWVKEFEDAAFALAPGEITEELVKTQFGYHIIKVEDKKEAKQLTFDEAKEQIETDLPNQRKQEVFNQYMQDMKENAEIVNNLADEAPAEPQMPADHPPVDSSQGSDDAGAGSNGEAEQK